ncbi:MAG: redoxin domain-containing protein [Planctomycetes bacterium]|nr:redoxin domain-containing protein [Planctomycetota bacterium]
MRSLRCGYTRLAAWLDPSCPELAEGRCRPTSRSSGAALLTAALPRGAAALLLALCGALGTASAQSLGGLAPAAQAPSTSSPISESAKAKPRALSVGQAAPEFALLDQAGRERPLAELLAEVEQEQSALILVFYGKDFAPAATALLRAWKERLSQLEGPPPRVLGISSDLRERNARFHEFLELPFDLLSDPDQRVAKLYGAGSPPSATTGSTTAESAPHAVFVVGSKGHVTYLDRDFRSTPADDFRALLRALLLQTARPAQPIAASGATDAQQG